MPSHNMYVILLSCVTLILLFLPPVVTTSNLVSVTRAEGENVVFMFNASTSILEATWGIRDGVTNNFKLVLITGDSSDVQLGPNLNSAGYAGRVSFVGDLSKGQAWFKITNLNINDTNQYMAQIRQQGSGDYNNIAAQLTVIQPIPASSLTTREAGEDVVFLFGTSSSILEVTWGIRDGDTNNFKLVLIVVDTIQHVQLTASLNSSSYAGRVSYVGDLSKGQAWFKITNLNINDTNQYMARIYAQGGTPGQYDYSFIKLIVTKRATTKFIQTLTREITTEPSSSQTSSRPTTSQEPHQLSNQSISITVVKQVYGDFSDPNSAAYKNFSDRFVSEINSVYGNVDTFRKAKVTSLSENSIPVKFVVYFKSTNEPDEICAPLKDAVKDNRLGNFKIVPGSLGCSNEPSQGFPKNQSGSACTCTSIISACVSVIIFLILVVVVLLIYIWRLKSKDGKEAGSRITTRIQDKKLEAYENVHPVKEISAATTTQTTRTSNAQKEIYETINENRDKSKTKAAIAANVKPTRDPSVNIQGDVDPSLPQHYQELQRMTPNPTPVYEPLKQRSFGNKGELTSKVPKTYEQLQQSAAGTEYQSLKSYKTDSESKV